MEVKGTAFLARKAYLTQEHGAARFEEVLSTVALRDPVFAEPILATARLPVDGFLRFNDAMVTALYGGDDRSYFKFGQGSAEWSFTVGPYRHLALTRSVDQFAASAPVMLRNFFTAGEARAELVGPDQVDTFLSEIESHHVYFEYALMGFFARGLQMVSGREVTMVVRRGFSRGDPDVHYEFHLA
jgi:hypothetical protein